MRVLYSFVMPSKRSMRSWTGLPCLGPLTEQQQECDGYQQGDDDDRRGVDAGEAIDNWDGSSGYHYSDDIIYGFSHTHLSGTGIPDGCDILFMPTVGYPQLPRTRGNETPEKNYQSTFSHSNEKAEPGYYSVRLDKGDILAELTATSRVGFHRYTFQRKAEAAVVLDLKWRDKVVDSEFRIVDDKRSEGYRRWS